MLDCYHVSDSVKIVLQKYWRGKGTAVPVLHYEVPCHEDVGRVEVQLHVSLTLALDQVSGQPHTQRRDTPLPNYKPLKRTNRMIKNSLVLTSESHVAVV
jgi:hypothetical protein